nr:uncharacterized protein LOC117273592 [Nicotiana tomentosiformis]
MEGVELAAYHLKGVAYSWFEMWEDSWEEGSPPVRWSEFVDAFIDHFLPPETRSACAAEFKNLKQAFAQAIEDRKLKNRREQEATSKARLVREAKTDAWFDQVVDISKHLDHIHKHEREEWEGERPRGLGGFGGASSGGQTYHIRGRPFRPAQSARQIPYGSLVSHSSYSSRHVHSSFSRLSA